MKECLNPYSNGICSRSIKQLKEALKDLESLNPYSNGICSRRERWLLISSAY